MNQQGNDNMESGIRSQFLSLANYKATMEFAQKRNDNYIKFCTLIQGYYGDFKVMSKHISDRIKLNQGDGLSSVKQFKQFLADFIRIIEEVATFKTEYYEQLREIEVDPIRAPTLEMISRIGKYNDLQIKYQQVYKNINATSINLSSSYNHLKKEVKDPLVYFDQKYVKTKSTNLQGLIKNKEEFEVQGNGLLDNIYKNTVQFEKEITFYRQKMLSGKYKVHKKLSEMSKGARQCLTQTLLALTEEVAHKYKKFQETLKQQIKESTLLSKFKRRINSKADQSNDKLSEIIITATQEYNELINQVQGIIKTLMEGFSLISVNCKEYSQTSKLIVQQLNKLYENDESPTPQMIQTLELFHFFCQKIGQIPNLLHIHQANVVKLRQNINKHSQITMTLLKCTVHKGKMDQSAAPNKNIQQLNHLFDQLSYDYINEFIDKIYKLMEDSLGYLKNYFNMKYHKKKKNNIEDSMDISHIEEQYSRPHKKPSKKELWLWKEFKNVQKYKRLVSEAEEVKEILAFIAVFNEIKIENQKEVDKFNCSISGKKQIKGVLKILTKNILFTSSNIDLNIPLDFVEEVAVNVKIFEKQLTIKTSIGSISFNHFPEFSKAQVLLNQQITISELSKKTTKKTSVELTPEQIEFINTRKAKIQSQLESLDGYIEQTSIFIEDTTVDVVYDIVYSDKPFKFKGKEYSCFMSYALKKSGGSNYTSTKYTPLGPRFYSLEEGKTFINTPLFSERTSGYEVPLPPIPFIPKFCTNKETIRIFWISNTQFDYFIKSESSGAPYADCFYLNILHKVTTKEKGVEIKAYSKLTFIKDTSMKGMISSKSAEQAKSKITSLLEQAAKLVKIGVVREDQTDGKTQKTQQQKAQDKDEDDSRVMGNQKLKDLENQKKILIGVLVAVILINLLLRLF